MVMGLPAALTQGPIPSPSTSGWPAWHRDRLQSALLYAAPTKACVGTTGVSRYVCQARHVRLFVAEFAVGRVEQRIGDHLPVGRRSSALRVQDRAGVVHALHHHRRASSR